MKKFVMLIALIGLSGCATIGDKVAGAVNAYCTEPYADRMIYRTAINNQLSQAGHTIAVTCQGDQ